MLCSRNDLKLWVGATGRHMSSICEAGQDIACYKARFLGGLNRKPREVLKSGVLKRQYNNFLAVQIGK